MRDTLHEIRDTKDCRVGFSPPFKARDILEGGASPTLRYYHYQAQLIEKCTVHL